MIERYSRPEMSSLWSDRARFDLWLAVELAVCEAWARRGAIPAETMATIRSLASYDTDRIGKIEAEVHHDVIAFLTAVAEKVGPDSRFIHMGMTSSDLLDTAFAIQLRGAGLAIAKGMEKLRAEIKKLAMAHKNTVMMGRSHGIHAEPITFGLKAAVWYDEFGRHERRLAEAVDTISVGKLSGAVGTFAHIDPEMESEVCAAFELKPAPVSTQIVQRDRHAHYFCTLAGIAASIEKVAVEIRHLQRTEVGEAAEPFGKGQKGSSAMPHKRNPVLCENLTGLARVVRANAMAALEDVALWHERDISHSSVERVIAPDSTILVDFMLARLARVLSELVVNPERMESNMEMSLGLYNSQDVLLALVREGATREEAYKAVQAAAMLSWEKRMPFFEVLMEDSTIREKIGEPGLKKLFDVKQHLRHVDTIFDRVFKKQ
ncbi:MAG: adenylosuccinate lyase [Proteobacteria bacterium]|nr:adenylosuccinate lyase [Pseudomonadota bacterium]